MASHGEAIGTAVKDPTSPWPKRVRRAVLVATLILLADDSCGVSCDIGGQGPLDLQPPISNVEYGDLTQQPPSVYEDGPAVFDHIAATAAAAALETSHS